MRHTLLALILLSSLLAGAADAKPPTVEGFVRLAQLRKQIAEKLVLVRAEEEFAGKPLPEQMLIKWDEGATKFGSKKIGPKEVMDQIFKWDEMMASEPSEAALRVIELLPAVMGRKFGQVGRMNRKFKKDRHIATKALVAQLVKPPLHVRKMAIISLEAVYSTRRTYVPTDAKSLRIKRQTSWEAYIKKLKK